MNTKKEKQPLAECDARIKEIRVQLNEQLKCIDQHTDSRTALLGDIQDFFKRKSEIESEYARKLEGLSEKFLSKQRSYFTVKKEQPDLALQTSMVCWAQMLEQCQRESKDSGMISNIYTSQVLPRLQAIADDISRLHKKNREIASKSHEDFLEDLRKLYQAMQLYQGYWAENAQAEHKFKQVDKQFEKRHEKTELPKGDGKVRRSTSLRKLEKLRDKRLVKYSECKLKCVKARNEYILQLEATNATLKKYYSMDLGNLLDASSIGYHAALQRVWSTYYDAETAAQSSKMNGVDLLQQAVANLDPTKDKKIFLENNHNSFAEPPSFVFTGHADDEVKKVSLSLPQLHKEIEKRCSEMERTVDQMTAEQDELKKNLTTSLVTMNQLSASIPCDVSNAFLHGRRNSEGSSVGAGLLVSLAPPPQSFMSKDVAKIRKQLADTETSYLQQFEEYLHRSNQLNRLQARLQVMQKALKEDIPVEDTGPFPKSGPPSVAPKPGKKSLVRRKRGKAKQSDSQSINHFQNDLQKYLKEFGRSIPLVVESCIRMINLYGLHHQGIFRVPGSHQDIMEMKSLFEKGEDPVSEKEDEADINTVSGLLKLYFRELDEKLFPQFVFDDLVQCAHISDVEERTIRIRQILLNIPESVLVVMRYLFAFLNHLSQNSDENMMDAYNIAVCFGPTLLPVPDTYDQVTTQANVNEIVKTIVLNHEKIFPEDMDGPVYEKVMASGDGNAADGMNADTLADQPEGGVQSSGSDDDSDQFMEGLAKYDYKGRSERELSFMKGDVLILYQQASDDWWKGSFKGKDGLVPNSYIIVQDVDGEVLSSRAESEVSLDSGGTPQSPAHRSIPAIVQPVQPTNRRLSADTSKHADGSKPPTKTKSLDRYSNVQEYMRQQKTMASMASIAAQQGLARSSEASVKSLRTSSFREDVPTVEEDGDEEKLAGVDPASMSVAARIAHFRKSTKGPVIDPDTLQPKTSSTLPRAVGKKKGDIDDTMRNALDELQALDMPSHKATPDVVLDTLDARARPHLGSLSDSPTHSSGDKTPSPHSGGQWKPEITRGSGDTDHRKSGKSSRNNNNNNNTSHYQVPTYRYQGMVAMTTGRPDFSLSAPSPMDPSRDLVAGKMRNSSDLKYGNPQLVKQGVRKTAL